MASTYKLRIQLYSAHFTLTTFIPWTLPTSTWARFVCEIDIILIFIKAVYRPLHLVKFTLTNHGKTASFQDFPGLWKPNKETTLNNWSLGWLTCCISLLVSTSWFDHGHWVRPSSVSHPRWDAVALKLARSEPTPPQQWRVVFEFERGWTSAVKEATAVETTSRLERHGRFSQLRKRSLPWLWIGFFHFFFQVGMMEKVGIHRGNPPPLNLVEHL